MDRSSSVTPALTVVTAIACTSARGTLMLLTLVALTALFTLVLRSLLGWLRLPVPALLSLLFAAAVGGGLYWCFSAFLDGAAMGGPLLPLVICSLSGTLDERQFSPARLFRLCAAALAIGAARELLADAALFGYPLPFAAAGDTFGQTAGGTIGVGGLLLAAGGLWLFRFTAPLKRLSLSFTTVWQVGLLSAAIVLLSLSLPTLSAVWRFWLCLLFTVIPLLFSPRRLPAWLVPLPSVIAQTLGEHAPLWHAAAVGAGVIAALYAFTAVSGRLSRSPRRGLTVPSLLCLTAILLTAV